MKQKGSEAEDHISFDNGGSKASERERLGLHDETVRKVGGESHDINDAEKEGSCHLEGESRPTNDSRKNVDLSAGESLATHTSEKELGLDMEGESYATNHLEKGVDREVEGESRTTNDLEKEGDDGEIPKVGMIFGTVEEAYNYYNRYARRIGFSVRKQRTNKCRGNRNKIQLQTLCCSCEGFYDEIRAPKKRRENTRFGCKAKFEIHITDDNNYAVTKFFAEHNHELVSPENLYLLRSQRKVDPSEVGVVKKVPSSRLQPLEIFCYMCMEASQAQTCNSVQCDLFNLEEKKHVEFLKRVDTRNLLDHFKKKKQENKHYFYSFWTNEDIEIRGIFFCDGNSRCDYKLFGDTLYFDTTYRTGDYNMVCATILGIHSHGHITIFGCGLLEDETTDAIVWFLTTFLEAMGGTKPKTVLTNQSMTSAEAIAIVFPETHLRLHLWHIYQNVAKHLNKEFTEFITLSQRFKECIFNAETVEEFENSWELLLKDFELKDNEWLQGLYELRQKWAQVYDHVHFCAGLTTTEMSENIHNFLKSLFGNIPTLRECVDQYARAMIMQRELIMEADYDTQEKTPFLFSNWSVEHEAANKYTNKIFCAFQDEYRRTLDQRLHVEKYDGTIRAYKIIDMENQRRNHTLAYNQSEQSVDCSCRKFEFHGVVCSHVLKFFHDLEVTSLPSHYYLKRWTKDAMDEIVYDSYGEVIPYDIDPLSTSRYTELSRVSQRIVMKGVKSSTMYSLAKSVMLELEAKVQTFLISGEELGSASGKNTSGPHGNLALNLKKDVPVQKRKTKRSRGPPKSNVKSVADPEAPNTMIPSQQMGNEGERVTMSQTDGGIKLFYQPIQEPFGFQHQLLHGQDQNQLPPWQAMYLPFNFMGCPEQGNRSFSTSDYMFMPQQASSAQAHEPQGTTVRADFPSSAPHFPDSSS